MKNLILFILTALILVAVVGCTQPINAAEAKSDLPRETAPVVSQSDMDTLVKGNSAFAFSLYQALKEAEGNLFYSPYSISEALAMTYAGARGNTEKQMAETLRYLLPQSQLHPAFNNLDIALAQRGKDAQGKDGKGFRLNVVNAIWGQQGFKFLQDYLDVLAKNYGAGLRLLDFIKATEQSRQTINQWVSDQTEEKIKDLLPQGTIDTDTRLVLTNAIYFNAAWAYPFEENATTDGKFKLLDGSEAAARFMRLTESYGYAKGSQYQAVELPYDGNELSMVVLLPDAGQFKTFESGMDSQQVGDIIASLKYHQIKLALPKFKTESKFSLKEQLIAMGMTDAFNNADFSGMDGKKDLEIADVVHKSYVAVDEAGTEAAAATAVIMRATAMPLEPVQVTVDRPFIFLIRDIKTGAILFIGRVLSPGM